MKRGLFLIVFTLSVYMVYSQETYEGTIVYEGSGTLTLENGEETSGSFRFYPNSPRKVFFLEERADKKEKIKIGEIKGFTINGTEWEKVINKGAVGSSDYFMQRLTPEGRNLRVYKYEQQNTIGTPDGYLVVREYYVQKEDWDQAYSVGHLKFTSFSKKGAKIFSDCPELSKKISKKQQGYKIGMISTDKMKADVFLKISEEYANCQ